MAIFITFFFSKMEYFTIELFKQDLIYLPGERVSGYVKLKCNQRIKIKSMIAYFKGEANVSM